MPMLKKLGRPPRISRETVLDASAEIAAADPAGAVSIGSIARHLKVTPMAIYTYFASKDELMQALSKRLLEGLVIDLSAEIQPLQRIRAWAEMIRVHFLANPPLIRMLTWEGGHNSIAWLNASAPLLTAIRELGLDEDTAAQTLLWTWAVTLGAVQFEIYYHQANPRISEKEMEELSDAVREDIRKIGDFFHCETQYERYFRFQIDRLIDALAALQCSSSAAAHQA